jgi:hypothetical protein
MSGISSDDILLSTTKAYRQGLHHTGADHRHSYPEYSNTLLRHSPISTLLNEALERVRHHSRPRTPLDEALSRVRHHSRPRTPLDETLIVLTGSEFPSPDLSGDGSRSESDSDARPRCHDRLLFSGLDERSLEYSTEKDRTSRASGREV